jgi:hypothetical protein
MLCDVLSPGFAFAAGGFNVDVLDCRELRGGGAVAEALLLSTMMLPVSLPLSLVARFGFALVVEACTSAASCRVDASETTLSSKFSNAFSTLSCGEGRGLTSCTVSRVEALPVERPVGVLDPGWR